VGSAIARAFTALGCVVRGVSRSGRRNDAFTCVRDIAALGHEAGAAQILILAIPNTPATHHLVNRDVLSACQDVVLISVGRGHVLDEAALVEALDAGHVRVAALDVFETEPLPAHSPLWERDDVFVSPHISGLTTVAGAATSFLESLASLEAGGPVTGQVDRERGY
jgi:phosphoglycerate dehydrogenase-like enzyme